jgi:hypothetical protein
MTAATLSSSDGVWPRTPGLPELDRLARDADFQQVPQRRGVLAFSGDGGLSRRGRRLRIDRLIGLQEVVTE